MCGVTNQEVKSLSTGSFILRKSGDLHRMENEDHAVHGNPSPQTFVDIQQASQYWEKEVQHRNAWAVQVLEEKE